MFIAHSEVGDYGLYQVHNLYCVPQTQPVAVNTTTLPLNGYDTFKDDI